MTPSDVEGLTGAVTGLAGEIQGLRAETQKLDVYGRRSRFLIRRLWLAYILVALLAAALVVGQVRDHHTAEVAKQAAASAQRNAVNAEQVCQTGNVARATTRALWEKLFTLPPIQALSPSEQTAKDAQVAIVRAQINTSYADQDCAKLGPQPVK